MMNEIEVGEYVRTIDGEIHKVIDSLIDEENEEEWAYYKFENDMGNFRKYITKHSKNIIDVIDFKDIITIKEETSIDTYQVHCSISGRKCAYIIEEDYFCPIEELEIISVLTHEKYENGCFRLEDNNDC